MIEAERAEKKRLEEAEKEAAMTPEEKKAALIQKELGMTLEDNKKALEEANKKPTCSTCVCDTNTDRDRADLIRLRS